MCCLRWSFLLNPLFPRYLSRSISNYNDPVPQEHESTYVRQWGHGWRGTSFLWHAWCRIKSLNLPAIDSQSGYRQMYAECPLLEAWMSRFAVSPNSSSHWWHASFVPPWHVFRWSSPWYKPLNATTHPGTGQRRALWLVVLQCSLRSFNVWKFNPQPWTQDSSGWLRDLLFLQYTFWSFV